MQQKIVERAVWTANLPKCRDRSCMLRLEWGAHVAGTLILHLHDEHVESLPVSQEDLLDADFDIWGEKVRPWLQTLHPDPGSG